MQLCDRRREAECACGHSRLLVLMYVADCCFSCCTYNKIARGRQKLLMSTTGHCLVFR